MDMDKTEEQIDRCRQMYDDYKDGLTDEQTNGRMDRQMKHTQINGQMDRPMTDR